LKKPDHHGLRPRVVVVVVVVMFMSDRIG
jgi:hypothetical protein